MVQNPILLISISVQIDKAWLSNEKFQDKDGGETTSSTAVLESPVNELSAPGNSGLGSKFLSGHRVVG